MVALEKQPTRKLLNDAERLNRLARWAFAKGEQDMGKALMRARRTREQVVDARAQWRA